jgi:phosphomannomutase
VLPILSILASAREQDCRVSQLVSRLPPRFTASDRLKNFPTDMSLRNIAKLAASTASVESLFSELCGKVSSMDQTDGLRITFENKEIIHLRPSGNAPELRCYNEAASQERVQLLNKACLELITSWR